jgi:DNA invertase Pin-like site-specific DNA recombinase
MKVVLYARVSTDDKNQEPETQLHVLRRYCQDAKWEIYKEYVDFARAKDYKHRTQWARLLKEAHQHRFSAVVVFKLDRAWRHTVEALRTLEDWDVRNIKFVSVNDQFIDTVSPMGKAMLVIAAAFAEMESQFISERVKAGINRTRAEGNSWGRPGIKVSMEKIKECINQGMNISQISKTLGYNRQKIYRVLEAEKISLDSVQKGGIKITPKNDPENELSK